MKALSALLSTSVKKTDVEAVFNSFDLDGNGSIDYNELNNIMRRVNMASHGVARPTPPEPHPTSAHLTSSLLLLRPAPSGRDPG